MRPNPCLSTQSAFEIADHFSTLHHAEILHWYTQGFLTAVRNTQLAVTQLNRATAETNPFHAASKAGFVSNEGELASQI